MKTNSRCSYLVSYNLTKSNGFFEHQVAIKRKGKEKRHAKEIFAYSKKNVHLTAIMRTVFLLMFGGSFPLLL